MTQRPRVLVVQPEDVCPIGMFGTWLDRAGVDCDVLAVQEGRALPSTLGDHAGLIVMGGRMGANDAADHRWMVPTKGLIVGTVAAGTPFLGICLGHQLATVALGGEVVVNPAGPTIGLRPWRPTSYGTSDLLTGVLPSGTPVLHHNNDIAARLPDGATTLGHAPDGSVQAARFGPRAWGVQFHPEVDAATVAGWARDPEDATSHEATRQLREREAELHQAWEPLATRFAALVGG
ncbi:type 1 glutamine amidotransferase [Ornithinimicrobium sufpigmenti]|uniref:type 1 glutamine amidotransferase n=1 Tax=Ornithinimicrobium sufpigmenti TaxID=2508882 RepID=UPI001036E4C0|nr:MULTISPECIES: type 1 glutamine amidotransferase [unclassified Ornithinimicrobium]